MACCRAFTELEPPDTTAGMHDTTFVTRSPLDGIRVSSHAAWKPLTLNRCLQRPADPDKVVIAVPNRVVLEHELAGERRIGVERHGGGPIELLVAESPDRSRGCRAVAPKQIERRVSRNGVVLSCVPGIHLVDDVPGHSRHWFAFGKRLRQLNLQRVHGGDVMHDHSDLPPVPGDARLPFLIGEGAREDTKCARTLLEAFGERICTTAR